MDYQIETILAETRKFGLGLFFATQILEQLPANVKGRGEVWPRNAVAITRVVILFRGLLASVHFAA